MLTLLGQNLLALLCASATFATSDITGESISNRHLKLRQNGAEDCATESYTTQNGLNFTVYCREFNPGNRALKVNGVESSVSADSYEECFEHCSRYWGDGEGCFGATWIDKSCWLRNSSTSASNMRERDDAVTGLVDRTEMEGFDSACSTRSTSLSLNTVPGTEIEYEIRCNQVIGDEPDVFDGYQAVDGRFDNFKGLYHTESLEECLEICVDLQPLCIAVSWNPGLEVGFANCWPKNGLNPIFQSPSSDQGIMHSAMLTDVEEPDIRCPENKTYYTSDDTNSPRFEIHCGEFNPGSNITALHANNITACIDACASSGEECAAVTFISLLDYGYKNCHLQSSTTETTDLLWATYAVLADADVSSSPAPSDSDDSDDTEDSTSKAWIAGPVVGGIAALAIVGFVAFWYRRRRSIKRGHRTDANLAGTETNAYPPAYEQTGGNGIARAYYDNGHVSELDGGPMQELPTETESAHKKKSNSTASELAT